MEWNKDCGYVYEFPLKDIKSSHINRSARTEDVLITSLLALIERLDFICDKVHDTAINTDRIQPLWLKK